MFLAMEEFTLSYHTLVAQHMTLAEFAEYFVTCTKPGQAVLNMISLEFR